VPDIAVVVCSFIKIGSPSIPPTVAVLCPYRFPLNGFFAFTVKGKVEYDFTAPCRLVNLRKLLVLNI
jgi:hypothetical protein